MFGLGFMEILFIAIVAIIFLGPDKLPGAMVDIAKFIKSAKNAITDAKQSLNEEVNLDELKREALGYKEQLDKATEELQGFKNLNPMNDLKEAADLGSVKDNFERLTQREPEAEGTQVEAKQSEEITFKKKTVSDPTLGEVKKENKALKKEAKKKVEEDQAGDN
ncbi:MAG: Twin-arginine translocation protein TatB [uncultured Sulfurovum sp.]|uniref:Sec-independent protein translocase protein TatB homolog n=1 Tax=uncultured Sulfurovum sp. TaxID=269237 RepID=A0A6S6RYU3_9BACT|nr:MAG: Twin-arginine translocation protein TatB [uncultured Sulfurovum sp.]